MTCDSAGHFAQTKKETALTTKPLPAGGRATQAGMDFGADVGAWFAAHLVSAAPVGGRFGLGVSAFPLRLQFETGTGLDDIEVGLSDGSTILVQCKTRPSLSNAPDSDLASTIAQLVRFIVSDSAAASPAEPKRTSAVLAVASDAPGSLNLLEASCRMFDSGGTWPEIYARISQQQRSALDTLRNHTNAEWSLQLGVAATDDELSRLASLLHIVRFDTSEGGSDRREAARILGTRVFGSEEAGVAPANALNAIVRRLVRSGAPANKAGVLRLLRDAGYEDVRAPGFDADIACLRNQTQVELKRLERHSYLPIDGGLAIPRSCMPALRVAVQQGSLLVIGEPGAGKTGVLVTLAQERLRDALPTVFLSVDNLYGVTSLSSLKSALDLEEPVLDVLQNWPGIQPGVLIVDALDSIRGGVSENAFAKFIEDALCVLGERWSIVASIRTFDLRNGRRFREAMVGPPPSPDFMEPGLDNVRHFRIPSLADVELEDLIERSGYLGELFAHAPESMRELLKNVFNLSIASELIAGGTTPSNIVKAATQSELLEAYENQRLPSTRLQIAVADSVKTMIDRRRLTVRKTDIGNEALDDVFRTGVLVPSGDRVQFAHHVLFDHAAGRFYLDWTDARKLQKQVTEDPAIGLLLGPSLKFALERVWRDDSVGRRTSWSLIIGMTSAQGIDPVIASVALRTVAESVESSTDVRGLCDIIRDVSKAEFVGPALTRLSRFVSMSFTDKSKIPNSIALSWTEVASEAISADHRLYVDAARFFLFTLSERADYSDRTFALSFGQAARQLLAFAMQLDPAIPQFVSNAIRMVTKSFDTDVSASRLLLSRILQEPRFTEHAHEEAPWLAEGIRNILRADPDFAVEIYDVLFGRAAPADGESWMGANASRIMPLKSNKRQDYDHARWHLQQALPTFLEESTEKGTVAANRAVLGLSERRRTDKPEIVPNRIDIGNQRVLSVLYDGLTLMEWQHGATRGSQRGGEALGNYARFLMVCSSADFGISVRALMSETSAASMWARVFGIAAQRPGLVDDLLWPIAISKGMLELVDVVRDAVTFIAAAFPARSMQQRASFEKTLLTNVDSSDEHDRQFWTNRASRFLSVISVECIAEGPLDELRTRFEKQGLLHGNRPYMTVESRWTPADEITDSLLTDGGVDLDERPNAQLRRVVRPLDSMLRSADTAATADAVASLWALTKTVVSTIDSLHAPPPDEQVLHASWGAVCNAIEKIVNSDHYREVLPEHPSQSALLDLLDRMATSPYPQYEGPTKSGLMSWGNWDVRVYVAASYMTLAAFNTTSAEALRARVIRMLDDPAPTVRLQVAQSVNTLWEVDRTQMWRLAEKIATEETDTGVIGFFAGGPLARLADVAPEKCEQLLAQLLEKPQLHEKEDRNPNDFHEAVATLAARLWIVGARTAAQRWILSWTATPENCDAYLWPLISWLREALFAKFAEGARLRDQHIQDRAREVLRTIVDAAGDTLFDAKRVLLSASATASEQAAAERKFTVGLRLTEHSCSQLYFGSGAFENGNADRNGDGLRDDTQKRDFLSEYEGVLDRIALSGNSAVSYRLVELYEYLIGAAPERVFDKIADVVIGPAASDGYHYESLALDTVARIVRRYLADHRTIFDDAGRRARLVRILELFSDAGWPDALKLLYELPDLLR